MDQLPWHQAPRDISDESHDTSTSTFYKVCLELSHLPSELLDGVITIEHWPLLLEVLLVLVNVSASSTNRNPKLQLSMLLSHLRHPSGSSKKFRSAFLKSWILR